MDISKAGLVVAVTLIAVVVLNAVIYLALRRGKTIQQIELLRRAVKRARHPWETEDENLKELSQRVAQLKQEKEDREGTKPPR